MYSRVSQFDLHTCAWSDSSGQGPANSHLPTHGPAQLPIMLSIILWIKTYSIKLSAFATSLSLRHHGPVHSEMTKVTRLGVFSPFGRLFTLGSFIFNLCTDVAWFFVYLLLGKIIVYILKFYTFWAIFSQTRLVTHTLSQKKVWVIEEFYVMLKLTMLNNNKS
jgi:hypothetical protein